MTLNANLKSTVVMLISKNIILLFSAIIFRITSQLHRQTQLLCTIKGLIKVISLCSSLTQSQTANNTTDIEHVFYSMGFMFSLKYKNMFSMFFFKFQDLCFYNYAFCNNT